MSRRLPHQASGHPRREASPDGDGERLWVEDVQARYRLRTRLAARQIMDAAGAMLVGGRLVVRLEHLVQWEEAQRLERQRATPGAGTAPPRRRRRGRLVAVTGERRPGWWREAS